MSINPNYINSHQEREGYVSKKLTEIISEFRSLFMQVDGKDVIPLRMQLVGAFTIIDVLGNYWFEYLGKTGKPKERFYEFIDNFCVTNKNITYRESNLLSRIDSKTLYDFRNSLVHFYGIGKLPNYAIITNPSTSYNSETINKIASQLKAKVQDIVIIQPMEVKDLVINASILMLKKMLNEIDNLKTSSVATEKHISGIERIFNKLKHEGAERVE